MWQAPYSNCKRPEIQARQQLAASLFMGCILCSRTRSSKPHLSCSLSQLPFSLCVSARSQTALQGMGGSDVAMLPTVVCSRSFHLVARTLAGRPESLLMVQANKSCRSCFLPQSVRHRGAIQATSTHASSDAIY